MSEGQPERTDQTGEQAPPPPPAAYPPPPPPPPGYAQPAYPHLTSQPGYYMGRKLAAWLQRVIANLTDQLAFWVPLLIGLFLSGAIRGPDPTPSLIDVLLSTLVVGAATAIWLYNRWVLQGITGQSWGKRLLRLRLVRISDGQPPGPGVTFLRDMAHLLDTATCFVGYLLPLVDARRQTLADKIMSTLVLHEEA